MLENKLYFEVEAIYFDISTGKDEIWICKNPNMYEKEETTNIKKIAFQMIEDEFGKQKIFIKKAIIKLYEVEENKLISCETIINNN